MGTTRLQASFIFLDFKDIEEGVPKQTPVKQAFLGHPIQRMIGSAQYFEYLWYLILIKFVIFSVRLSKVKRYVPYKTSITICLCQPTYL